MNNIKRFRIEKGLTQEQLGKLFGLKKTTVCKWEADNSNPNIETLIKLSKYFDCLVDDLITKSDQNNITTNEEDTAKKAM